MLDSRSRFSTGKGFLPTGRVVKVCRGCGNEIVKKGALRHRRQSANLKRSCNRNVNEQVLYWQGPPHLLNLIAVLVLLHEEHVGDILRLAGLKDIGKLWGILGSIKY